MCCHDLALPHVLCQVLPLLCIDVLVRGSYCSASHGQLHLDQASHHSQVPCPACLSLPRATTTTPVNPLLILMIFPVDSVVSRWNKSDVRLIYPPVDCNHLKALPLAPRDRLVISIAQYRPEKNHMLQLDAFAVLNALPRLYSLFHFLSLKSSSVSRGVNLI